MIWYKYSPTFLVLIIAILCIQCGNDDFPPDDAETFVEVELGSFELLQSNIDLLPYLNKTAIRFVDSLGQEVVFDIDEQELINAGAWFERFDFFNAGDTVRFNFNKDIKAFDIDNDSLNVHMRMDLSTAVPFGDPQGGTVADVLNIFCQNPDDTNEATQVFYHMTDVRTWPTDVLIAPLDSLTILDRTFEYVYNTGFQDPKSEVNFNYKFGILSFTDHDGKLWRFEELE